MFKTKRFPARFVMSWALVLLNTMALADEAILNNEFSPLIGTSWVMKSIGYLVKTDVPQSIRLTFSVINNNNFPHAMMNGSNQVGRVKPVALVSGSDGCNGFSTIVTKLTHADIAFGEGIATAMYCSGLLGEISEAFKWYFPNISKYSIVGNELHLTNESDVTTLVYIKSIEPEAKKKPANPQ
jgi:META domain